MLDPKHVYNFLKFVILHSSTLQQIIQIDTVDPASKSVAILFWLISVLQVQELICSIYVTTIKCVVGLGRKKEVSILGVRKLRTESSRKDPIRLMDSSYFLHLVGEK